MPGEISPESSSGTTRLTPDSDSDSDIELGELGESFKLHTREKTGDEAAEEEDAELLDSEGEKYHDGPRRRRASVSTVQSYQLYTPDEERAVVRKFDRRLVLFVALLYMLSFLDRSSMFLFLFIASSI